MGHRAEQGRLPEMGPDGDKGPVMTDGGGGDAFCHYRLH